MTVASLDGDGGLCEAEVYHTQHAVDAVCKAFMWALCDFFIFMCVLGQMRSIVWTGFVVNVT